MDLAVLREFQETASEFLGPLDATMAKSGFDKKASQVVHGKINFRVLGLDDLSQIISSVEVGEGSLVLAADVLANSLLHHLEGRATTEGPNSPAAVEGHPLERLFYGASNSDLSDALFGGAESQGNDEGKDA